MSNKLPNFNILFVENVFPILMQNDGVTHYFIIIIIIFFMEMELLINPQHAIKNSLFVCINFMVLKLH
jgi:hypothetical protein